MPAVNVLSGGKLAPGNIGALGTFMTVTGNLTFAPGATYLVRLGTTAASRVNAGGNASLHGTVDAVFMPGVYASSKSYDMLQSQRQGFRHSCDHLSPNFTTSLGYTSTDVFLNLGAELGRR